MQDQILNDSPPEPVKPSSCVAQLRGATYCLRMDMRDGCLEATVKKRSLSSQALTMAVFFIMAVWTWQLRSQVASIVTAFIFSISAWSYTCNVAHETVRVLPGVGIVLISTSVVGCKLCRFLAWEHAGPMIINEHVTTVAVSSYLAVLDVQAKKLLPVFDHLRPPLKLLQHVYRAAMSMNCKCLSGDDLDWESWNAAQ